MLTAMLQVLVSALVIGMSAAGLVPVIRVAPWVRDWVQEGEKPWACDICMSFWSTALLGALWAWLGAPLLAAIPAYVVTLALVRRNSDPTGKPHDVPDLVDLDARPAQTPHQRAESLLNDRAWEWERSEPGL